MAPNPDVSIKGPRIGFPLVVGLISSLPTSSLTQQGLLGIKHFLEKLRKQTPCGVLIIQLRQSGSSEEIARAAKEAGVGYRSIPDDAPIESQDPSKGEMTTTARQLLETSDLLVLLCAAPSDERSNGDLLAYAHGIGRPVVRIDPDAGVMVGDIPPQLEHEQGWLAELFETAGLPLDADLETIKLSMSEVANRAAPVTRRRWKWILFLQGLAVLIPMAWLIRHPGNIPVGWVGVITFCIVILLLAVNWWLRWRNMEKTWARARLVAELARSLLVTAGCPRQPGLQALAGLPSFRSLRWIVHQPIESPSFPEWRSFYLENRIGNQEEYFRAKQVEAEKQRKQLSRWITLLLDITLAFAFAGIVISLVPGGQTLRRIFGEVRLEMVLGFVGVLMPLGLLLIQILRGVQELNRRTARFAQQRLTLQQARVRLTSAPDPETAMEVIEETERALLAEVLEWYFHAETAEHYFQIGRKQSARSQPKYGSNLVPSRTRKLAGKALGATGLAGLFLLRVVLGRVPWIVGSGVAALVWIASHLPGDASEKAKLLPLATLHGTDGGVWIPDPAKAAHGAAVIVHGLYGHSVWTNKKEDWLQNCADEIEKRSGDAPPEICLVDWAGVATPSKIYDLGPGDEKSKMLQDVVAIREQAYQVGELLGMRLALLMADGTMNKNQPCHLIGHSAGGFVVTRAARVLKKLNLAPSSLYVTILDTPAPDNELLFDLPEDFPTDFYITSPVGGRNVLLLLADFSGRQMHRKEISAPAEKGWLDQHRWAYTWFIDTISHPESAPNEGFNRSPLLRSKKTY